MSEMTRDQVLEALKPYPNLEAIILGCVSGRVSEWPAMRVELVMLISSQRQRIAELEVQVMELRRINFDYELGMSAAEEHIAKLEAEVARWKQEAQWAAQFVPYEFEEDMKRAKRICDGVL